MGANTMTNTSWKKERLLESLTEAKSASGQSAKPLSIRQVEWRLHSYFEELNHRRRMGVLQSPHGRHVIDGGAGDGEFRSKIHKGIEYTDIDSLAAYAWVDAALPLLKQHNRNWFIAVWLTYERLSDNSVRPPRRCIEIVGAPRRTFYDHLNKGRDWLIKCK